jgi:two-component system NtrC family sensor kinase
MSLPILCVTSDSELVQSLSRLLVQEAQDLHAVAGMAEAIAWLEEQKPSMVIVDQILSDGDGLQLLEEVRRRDPVCQRIVLLDDWDTATVQAALNYGTIQYIVGKPVDPDDLLGVIEGAMATYVFQEKQGALGDLLKKQNVELETMTRQLESMVDRRTRQIERAKKEWERTFDAIADPLILVDSHFTLLRANLAAAKLAGLPVRSLPGSSCHKVIFGGAEPCVECPLSGHRTTWSSVGSAEADVADERHDKMFRLTAFLLEQEPDQSKFICYYKDVTEQKRLQRQVLQAEKMAAIGQLAGGVAHELNNPIGVVLSFTQFSLDRARALGDEELLDDLGEIDAAAKRCQKIVQELLEFSRPSMDTALVDLNQVVEKALFFVSTQKAARSLEVRRELADDLPPILGNANQLIQVFVNLIQNAVHAMPDGGTLTLKTQQTLNGSLAASVTDTGVGIDAKEMGRLFEPFYTTKPPGKGTGLGLTVSYGIVERHAGRIDVESEKGKGARFTVTLPPAPVSGSIMDTLS